jgi:hypothetical protein
VEWIEYLSQTNDNVDFLDYDAKFKFIDDLSVLEMINLVMSGISCYNFKQHVASDIGTHGQYLPIINVQSQNHLDKISNWTQDKQMALNRNKTKYMVVNFTKKFKFNTRISLENTLLEEVSTCKLLGLTFNNQLSWQENTQNIIKRANTRMLILHKLFEFNLPIEEMINIYTLFIRSVAEYSSVVWHSSITEEESNNIERVQKIALRIILNEDYSDYASALEMSGLLTLRERRKNLSLNFAKKCLRSDKSQDLFPLNVKNVNTRPHEKFFVTPARTERLARSTIPYLQKLLNQQ